MKLLSVDLRPVAASQLAEPSTRKILLKIGTDRHSGRELPLKSTATHHYS
jgi:hypothetical protein